MMAIPGVVYETPRPFTDERGLFVKYYHKDSPFRMNIAENFYTHSLKGVLRGLHFQTPPHETAKLVTCVNGSMLDVIVDMRRGSPTYGQYQSFVLDAREHAFLYVPRGCAHGYAAREDHTIVVYHADGPYAPEHDGGIHWASLGIDWGATDPIVSKKDKGMPDFSAFDSPFVYEGSLSEGGGNTR